MAKLWRNKRLANQQVTIYSRRLTVDGDGFIRTELEPEEINKLHRIGEWSLVDPDSFHVAEESIAALTVVLNAAIKELEAAADNLRAHERKVNAINARIEEIRARSEAPKVEKTPDIDPDTASFRELKKAACEIGIDPADAPREELVAAVKNVVEPAGKRGRKKDGE